MKTIKYIVHLIILFLLSFVTLNAQVTDQQRLDRDIRIAEGILSEMFSEEGNDFSFRIPGSSSVKGEYISGAGIHFTIAGESPHRIQIFGNRGSRENVQVNVSGRTEKNPEEREEEIRQKITEYFKTYAPLISQLPDDEAIRVSYGINQSGSGVHVFFFDGDSSQKESVPAFTMWVNVSDLKQFKEGNISENEFTNRINDYDLSEVEEKTDLNVFASVLETALQGADTEHLQVTRKPRANYLPGLGVHYQVQVSSQPGFMLHELNISDDDIHIRIDSAMIDISAAMESLSESMAPLTEKLEELYKGGLTREERDSIRRETRELRRDIQGKRDSIQQHQRFRTPWGRSGSASDTLDLSAEVDAITNQLREVISDYGSTLTSLGDDELLMITLNWSGRNETLPLRTEVRIQKSDLLNGRDPSVEEIMRR